jgi:hypothetical protein
MTLTRRYRARFCISGSRQITPIRANLRTCVMHGLLFALASILHPDIFVDGKVAVAFLEAGIGHSQERSCSSVGLPKP